MTGSHARGDRASEPGHAGAEELSRAIESALDHLAGTQDADGSWHGDYGGPMFLLPMYVGTCHVIGLDLDEGTRAEMRRYVHNHQNDDGGFGLHVEGASMVFPTALNYVALRLLGEPADEPGVTRAREWLAASGGPLWAAPWGKYFLAFLGLYDYRGVQPVPPELWLLPEAAPFHPSRMWCHCRMVYLPLSYLYGRRFQAPVTPIIEELRRELYAQPYDAIRWRDHVATVADSDCYVPTSPLMVRINQGLRQYERVASRRLREKALAFVLDQIRAEDRNTSSICIGPISKLFHMLVWHLVNPAGSELDAHRRQLPEYLYHAGDGIKMQGYNSSQLWDTVFAVQAAAHASSRPGADDARRTLASAATFIEAQQVIEEVYERKKCFRGPSKGGWPFSTRTHGWPITDCTAEGIKASLVLERAGLSKVPENRLVDAVDFLLALQNDDGGWATYERTRGPRWLELLNPSSCFGDIMIDYSFVECTSASVQALVAMKPRLGGQRAQDVQAAIEGGGGFLLRAQRGDGSWEGSWGVCFTYGTWFGLSGLRAAGLGADHPSIERAAQFLLAHQLADGGWGELTESNWHRTYVSTRDGQAVMTAWALLALCGADLEGHEPFARAAARAVRFLIDRQQSDGSFPDEHIAGIFNRTAGIHYDNYLQIFPLWALAEARARGLEPAGA